MARILVVDDEESVRDFVQRALQMHGHDIRTAKDGGEAGVLLDQFRFDALVSDIRMPVMDGISLALKVKSEQPDLKVLLMTGFSSELKRAHNIGRLIDSVITKPFTIEQLNEAVQHLFHDTLWMAPGGPRAYSASQSGTRSSDKSSSSD